MGLNSLKECLSHCSDIVFLGYSINVNIYLITALFRPETRYSKFNPLSTNPTLKQVVGKS